MFVILVFLALGVWAIILLATYFIWQIIEHILYYFSLYENNKNKKAFIPIYNKYLLGKMSGSKAYSVVLVIISSLKLFLDLWIIDGALQVNIFIYDLFPKLPLWFGIMILVSYYFSHCICASKIYKKEAGKILSTILTVFSYLSLGALIPIFILFINKIKKTHNSIM